VGVQAGGRGFGFDAGLISAAEDASKAPPLFSRALARHRHGTGTTDDARGSAGLPADRYLDREGSWRDSPVT
jgi:hypothetical protein